MVGRWLQFAGGLSHFGAGLSVEASADESSSVHHLGEVHPLEEAQQSHACFTVSSAQNKPPSSSPEVSVEVPTTHVQSFNGGYDYTNISVDREDFSSLSLEF